MDELQFWKLIGYAKLQGDGDLEEQLSHLMAMLSNLTEREIYDYDRIFHDKLNQSYTWDLWAAAHIINGGCSDEGFDYFRAWLIAQGEEIFTKALLDPETLAEVIEPDENNDFFYESEEMLSVAADAYYLKTRRSDFFQTLPEPYEPLQLKGEQWDEHELQDKFPVLCARVRW